MQPTEKEIDTVLDECAEYLGSSKFPGMTYEEGVEAANNKKHFIQGMDNTKAI